MRVKRKILALLLCVTMIFSLVPTLAIASSAEDAGEGAEWNVTGWEWADVDGLVYAEDPGRWELAVSTASEKSPMMLEELIALLPGCVTATLAAEAQPEPDDAETPPAEDGTTDQPDDLSSPRPDGETDGEPVENAGGETGAGAAECPDPEPSASPEQDPADPAEAPADSDPSNDSAAPTPSEDMSLDGDAAAPGDAPAPEAPPSDSGDPENAEPSDTVAATSTKQTDVSSSPIPDAGGQGGEPSENSQGGGNPVNGNSLNETDPAPYTPEPSAGDTLPQNGTKKEDEAQTAELALTWTAADYPEAGAFEGEYTLSAALPDGYALAAEAPALEVTVVFQPANLLGDVEQALEGIRVRDVPEIPGTIINVFDYWTGKNRTDPDDIALKDRPVLYNQGINSDRAMKFAKNPGGYKEGNVAKFNVWTGNEAPYQNIVENTLTDGYPVLNEVETGSSESLNYLFDPSVDVPEGRESFSDVGGLLQIDGEGYYYYDSQKNYAYLNETAEEFELYSQPGVSYKNDLNQAGQFFPFTDPAAVFSLDNEEKLNGLNTEAENKVLNHYFGLTMTTRFVQKNGGQSYGGKEIIYEFSGDDDVWVFIDDVLVADLGGLHDRASLSINFKTGAVQINGGKATTLKAAFMAAGKETATTWSGDTFADDTYHTLKFFYLERGNNASNMSLKYNLIPIPESEIEKVNQENNPVPGAGFALYSANKNYEAGGLIYSGKTDADGRLYLRDRETDTPITFKELSDKYDTNYFVLKETTIPDGYQHGVGDVHLRYDEETGLILSDNYWDTGAYASPKITVTAPTKLYEYGIGGGQGQEIVNLATAENPLLFAVVFKRVSMDVPYDEESNWVPVSGDPRDGWTVWDDNRLETILKAARADASDGQSNEFQLESGGAFQVEIQNLPGDANTYYSMLKQKGAGTDELNESVRYTVDYYYVEGASSLADATPENIKRLYTDDFMREFSVRLYVPNIKNYLVTQKVDENGEPLNGATISLYKESNVTEAGGVFTVNAGAKPYDTVTTQTLTKENDKITLDGAGYFPAEQTTLERGVYYLVEEGAPEGYAKNPAFVKVVVDEYGVYADAGTEGDGISTYRGAGSIVMSMSQFAEGNGIDATLHDIKVQLKTAEEYEGKNTVWSFWDDQKDTLHLYYNPDAKNSVLQYVPNEDGEEPYIGTDIGWSRLEIRQCLEHHHDDTEYKEDIENRDLKMLFSTVLCVRIEDQPLGSLTIRKTVNGADSGTEVPEFRFTVTLKDAENNPISGTFGEVTFDETGTAEVTVAAGASLTIPGLPDGAQYTVTEQEADGWTLTSSNGATGTIHPGEAAEVSFINTKEGQEPETGNLKVTKIVTGAAEDAAEKFDFVVKLGDDSVSGQYGDMTFEKGIAEFQLGAGESKTAEGLPSGITYQVEELLTDSQKTKYTAEPEQTEGTIPANDTAEAAITNHVQSDPQDPDEKMGRLTVTKTVSGSRGDRNRTFHFTVTLSSKISGKCGEMEFTDGVAEFTLKHGESKSAWGEILVGLEYQVTEKEAGEDGYTTNYTNQSGKIPDGSEVTVTVENIKRGSPSRPDDPDDPDTPPDDPDLPPDDPDIPPDEPDTPPDDPDTPPDHPEDPKDPGDPGSPDDPGAPDGPGEPDGPGAPDEPDGPPKTGDESTPALWLTLLLAGLGGIAATVTYNCKKNNQKR